MLCWPDEHCGTGHDGRNASFSPFSLCPLLFCFSHPLTSLHPFCLCISSLTSSLLFIWIVFYPFPTGELSTRQITRLKILFTMANPISIVCGPSKSTSQLAVLRPSLKLFIFCCVRVCKYSKKLQERFCIMISSLQLSPYLSAMDGFSYPFIVSFYIFSFPLPFPLFAFWPWDFKEVGNLFKHI